VRLEKKFLKEIMTLTAVSVCTERPSGLGLIIKIDLPISDKQVVKM
jgi:hypothetical protein